MRVQSVGSIQHHLIMCTVLYPLGYSGAMYHNGHACNFLTFFIKAILLHFTTFT